MSKDDVARLLVDADSRIGDGGFLTVRRVHLRNERADGSVSKPYVCDFVVRPRGDDAVVVVLFRMREQCCEVLLRRELRPALFLGRPDDDIGLFLEAVVAGVIEKVDVGESGKLERAVAEVHEEAGYQIATSALQTLGPPMYVSPGAMVERLHFFSVEIAVEANQDVPPGDGTPMEEGAVTRWVPLGEALAMCEDGRLSDLKTELALRRLAARLSHTP